MDIQDRLMEIYKDIRRYGAILSDVDGMQGNNFVRSLVIRYDKGGIYDIKLINGEVIEITKLD